MANEHVGSKDWAEVFAAWFAPINRETAEVEVKQIAKAWYSLAMVQFVIALFGDILPLLNTYTHMDYFQILYALPMALVGGFIYGHFKSRAIKFGAAIAMLAGLAGEVVYHVYFDVMQMIQADVNQGAFYTGLAWRAALGLLALRSLWAALALPAR